MQNHVLDYLNHTVKKCPDKVAFANEKEGLTFREVYEQSRAIGTYLHCEGIYREPVVVFMEKHPKTITAFFGVIYGGNFYVPIDDEMPRARIDLILDNLHSKIMICDEKTAIKAKEFATDMRSVLYDDAIQTTIDDEALTQIYDKTIDTDPIYVVFTSGSTGIPKGVAACHRSVLDYIEQLSEVLHFDETTVFANQTPLYFDACLKELYPTLKFGATTYLVPKQYFMFPMKLIAFLNDKKVNTICWVVSALTFISSFGTFEKVKPLYLRTVAFGSEVFPIKQFNLWKETLPDADFVNLYGPTEGTGMCCYYRADRYFEEGETIPIGRPFKNTEILLLDEHNQKADEGEICIRGTCVTLGYYNNPDKTSEVFVQNPLHTAYPEIIYRTGDIGKLGPNNELLFVSRKDYQIKHMGHRIELGEIEANVNMITGIRTAACVYVANVGKIVLYYVGETDVEEVIIALRKKLPRYMIPNFTKRLDTMPLTENGKINRRALLELFSSCTE